MSQDDVFYTALIRRDRRYDGRFIYAVKTTGIYCRPTCPAKPKKENVVFFGSTREAEKEGYRACLRCRPKAGNRTVVDRAVQLLPLDGILREDEFAARFGMSARHLRRLFRDRLGFTPKQILDQNRLVNARRLLSETDLDMQRVSERSGFQSLRRFNDAFRKTFHRTPSSFRDARTQSRGKRK